MEGTKGPEIDPKTHGALESDNTDMSNHWTICSAGKTVEGQVPSMLLVRMQTAMASLELNLEYLEYPIKLHMDLPLFSGISLQRHTATNIRNCLNVGNNLNVYT